MRPVLTHEIPATVGLVRAFSYPVLRYFRTLGKWNLGALTPQQVNALTTPLVPETSGMIPEAPLEGIDRRLADVLFEDGRATIETLARRASTSETTAARRLEWILANRRVQIRALVEPLVAGRPVEAMLWLKASPDKVEQLGRSLASHPQVRYAAAVAGERHVVADVVFETNAALYDFTTRSEWTRDAEAIETTLLLHARKRGGRLNPGEA
ncbi:Lrp/AsnC family transcriptional regulator [Zafaria sp. Z1313]|uniref:Lrp/AsnC family transcriptional regulator n=1 Tax=Zafaria sp. Z1313 TaxID=3423202 RepID=UPI003D3025B5